MAQHPGPYDGFTDQELMDRAKAAAADADAEPAGSPERAARWATHETVINELKRRLVDNVRRKLGLPYAEISDTALAPLDLSRPGAY